MNRALKWGLLLFFTVFVASSFINIFSPVPLLARVSNELGLYLPFPFFTARPGTRSAIINDFCFRRRVGAGETWRDAVKPVGCGTILNLKDYQLAYALAYPPILRLGNIGHYNIEYRAIMTAFLNQLCVRESLPRSAVEVTIRLIDQTNGDGEYLLTTSAEQSCDSRMTKFQDFKLEAVR